MESELLAAEYKDHLSVLEETVNRSQEAVDAIITAVVSCFKAGNKLLLCGNGGSAADAQHVAGEFVNRFRYDHSALPAIALTTDSSVLTCIANDSAYEQVFARQVEALARPGDILAGISTSGLSANVLRALEKARTLGVTTLGFSSENGRFTMERLCDIGLYVPSKDTARIQESHLFLWHFICGRVEEILFPGGQGHTLEKEMDSQ